MIKIYYHWLGLKIYISSKTVVVNGNRKLKVGFTLFASKAQTFNTEAAAQSWIDTLIHSANKKTGLFSKFHQSNMSKLRLLNPTAEKVKNYFNCKDGDFDKFMDAVPDHVKSSIRGEYSYYTRRNKGKFTY